MRGFIQGFGAWAVLVYILLMALNTVTIMPPTLIMIVLSGVLFGPVLGAAALFTGQFLGSMAAFFIARLLAQDYVTARLGGRAAEFNERLSQNGFYVVFVARVLGLPPYEFIGFACGLSKIAFSDYLLAMILGTIPNAILYAVTGDRLLHPSLSDPLLYVVPAFFVVTLIVTRAAAWLRLKH